MLCILLIQTYELYDYLIVDSQTSDKSRYTVTSGTASLTYSSDGLYVKGTSSTTAFTENTAITLPSSYVLECTVTNHSTYGYYGGFCVDDVLIDFTNAKIDIYKFSTITMLSSINHAYSSGDVFKLEMDNGTMKIYYNNTLITTQTISTTGKFKYRQDKDRGIGIKDLKVKPL